MSNGQHFLRKYFLSVITLLSLLSAAIIYLHMNSEIKLLYETSPCSSSVLVDCNGTLSLADSYYKIANTFSTEANFTNNPSILISDFSLSTIDPTTNLTTDTNSNSSNTFVTGESITRIKEKLNRNEAIKISMLNRPDWLTELPPALYPCLRHRCVFDAGNIDTDTDVVFVYGVLLKDKDMPPDRWPGQLYVFGAMESPLHLRSQANTDKSVWRHAFNLTATYKRDADIFWPYGTLRYEPIPVTQRPNYTAIAMSRNKTAVWLVSNCKTQSQREKYVEEMKKYIDIDIYGRCGQKTSCSRANYGPCMVQLLRQYKFYIAFENSLCDDYVSEKLFKTFVPNNHIIPVVRGGADYDKLLPNGTFVNADWFRTAKELALFLKNLSVDLLEYSRYLQVKDSYRSESREKIVCTLCETLTSPTLRPRVYDIKTWLDGQCRAPRAFT